MQFRSVLDAARKLSVGDFEWYPYNSLSNAHHLEKLLGDGHRSVLDVARSEGILDVGCGDGDLSFLFESLGYLVTAADYAPSNHNRMEGLRALHRQMGSKVAIREMDVDNGIPLDASYGVTLCLGILYHLKNPFLILDRLARISRYCLLSTRIARRLPNGSPMPANQPLAYLLGEDELNADDTNFWIFSEQGLRRLFERTKWEVVEMFTTGDTVGSDPVNPDHDERAFCLLRSHFGCRHLERLEGWHHAEESGWRWTERRFTACATSDSGMKFSRIEMRLFVPPMLIEKFGSVTLRGKINGQDLPPLTVREAGPHTFSRKFPESCGVAALAFEMDHALGAESGYERELGVIVASLEML